MLPAIQIRGLSKSYRLGVTHAGSLRELANRTASALLTGKRRPAPQVPPEHADRVDAHGWFWALRDISFDVQPGEVIGIIGKNGAGKSTLLKILSRITTPTTGHVELRGRVASLLEVGTGFHPELTGRENVYLNGTILGMTKAEVHKKFDAIVNFAGIERFIDTPVKRYSSGMTVRLGFAVAAHLDPEILIVDEVLAVGDVEFQQRCQSKMQEVSRSGKTVLFVSHNMASIRALTDRAAVISRGRLVFLGPTSQAVGYYTSQNAAAGGRTVSVLTAERCYPKCSRDLEMAELTLMSSEEDDRFEEGSEVEFMVGVIARRLHDPFLFGITILRDDHTPVGSTFSPRLDPVPPGAQASYHLRLPTRQLAPGRYHCLITLGEARSDGRQLIDAISDVLPFEITPRPLDGRGWPSVWGPIRFDDLKVIAAVVGDSPQPQSPSIN